MLTNQEAIELLKGIQKEEEDSLRDLGVEAISLAIQALSTPTAEWEEEHEVSCGKILQMRVNIIEHKCNNCKRWGIKWAGTIPDNYCSNCGAKLGGANNG